MPVTLYPADHPAAHGGKQSCPDEFEKSKEIIQSSFDDIPENGIFPEANGFVNAAWWAYSKHHHLQIRPEDVWFSILTQLSFYINKNAEELRSHFVAHEGKKEVKVYAEGPVDFGKLAITMTKEMEEHIVDPKLREWIMPDFTTTEATDKVTAAILMMGSMQSYFGYTISICCGLPSATLLRTKNDWLSIRKRIDKITEFGQEMELFTKLLRPVLDRLVRSFDHPEDPDILDFWGKIVHWEQNGSGPDSLSGWITAFCFWTPEGRCLYRRGLVKDIMDPETGQWRAGCNIDGVQFHHVDTGEIPKGFVSVPVNLIANKTEYKTRMVAGSVGVKVWSSGDLIPDAFPRPGKATARPRARIQQDTKKEANKVARLREFRGSASQESPDKATAVNELPDTASKLQVPQGELKARLDSVQPVSGWWMYELKIGREYVELGIFGKLTLGYVRMITRRFILMNATQSFGLMLVPSHSLINRVYF
ncbi:hypothetical protein LCI18_000922 [Fusarium solani-melongenae]|uniref:Uncharacterized protein n=1 Tax=Fusarium solani subsp. cucurbitae TaxID=2747967 RepID=A0ACD3YLV9_FUSSC|nr:hypothetical protein LCI18_000922 [Fusarium solani-melongenae]